MARTKDTRTLVGDDKVVLRQPLETKRQWQLFALHLQDVIDNVLNAGDDDVNVFTDGDVLIVADAMVKAIYDTQDRGIVDASSERIVTTLKASPGTINPGEAVYVTIGGTELADNTFLTGICDGVALDIITDLIPGRVLVNGLYLGDTSLWAPLDLLWLGPVPGLLTNVPPVAGEKNQLVGLVLTSDPVNGLIQINPSDVRNTDADFSIYNPTTNIYLTALDVQAALDQVEAQLLNIHYNEYAESEAVSTESASVWTSKVLLTIPLLAAGDYTWEWTAEVNMSSANRMVNVKFEDDAVIAGEADIEPKDTGNWYTVGGFRKITQAVAAPKTLEIFFKRSANPGTASMRRARIILKSV